LAIPLPVRFKDEVIDAGSYPPEVARELCRHLPLAGERKLGRQRICYVAPKAQARRERKLGVILMVRSVFGESAKVV